MVFICSFVLLISFSESRKFNFDSWRRVNDTCPELYSFFRFKKVVFFDITTFFCKDSVSIVFE